MITAAGAAAATGVRVFSATSSQGLLHAMEMLYTVSGWRAPFVLVNVSRGLSAPITLEADHNDILAARDSGFLQIHCADLPGSARQRADGLPAGGGSGDATAGDGQPGRLLPVLHPRAGSPARAGSVAQFLPPFDPGSIRFAASAPRARQSPCWAAAPIPISATRPTWQRSMQSRSTGSRREFAPCSAATAARWRPIAPKTRRSCSI